MKLIVGLGNPGDRYEKTRHNLGFMVVGQFLKDFENTRNTVWEDNKRFKSDIKEIEWQPKQGDLEKVILAKPKTYMNNSGLAVSLISAYFNFPASDIWIIHDDIDLPLGSMKIRFGGASAGHRGVDSIIKSSNTDKFWRFRLGIGHPKRIQNSEFKIQNLGEVDDFVLEKFRSDEAGKVREIIKRGSKAIEEALEKGLERAMNRFNTK